MKPQTMRLMDTRLYNQLQLQQKFVHNLIYAGMSKLVYDPLVRLNWKNMQWRLKLIDQLK